MAAAATSAMSHNIMSMSSAPRVRPPRIPKGTPNINTEPQPEGKVTKGKVWVQGKWREAASRAVQQRQEIYSRRVEKALKHETLGTNIYAYNHIRTKQVVYSLTRNMENNKIMDQLLFHGKKTVPAALRRDMWTPYFSLHFPPTEYGAEVGKLAYRRLRELSLQRQLSPPDDMVLATERDIEEIKAKYDPVTLKDVLEYRDLVLPKKGQRLHQKIVAKRLMDQKATSVADVQFVLELCTKGSSAENLRNIRLAKFRKRMENMGRRAKTRLQKIRQLEARKRDLVRSLASRAQSGHPEGHLTLTKHAAARISAEYLGYNKLQDGLKRSELLEEAKEAKATEARLQMSITGVQAEIDALLMGHALPKTGVLETEVAEGEPVNTSEANTASTRDEESQTSPISAEPFQPNEIKMMWADQRDTAYAPREWPEAVIHGDLNRWAVSKVVDGRSRTKVSRSIHVMGGREDNTWAQSPAEHVDGRRGTEEAYEKRQLMAAQMEGKIVEAVQKLRKDPHQTTIHRPSEELTHDEKILPEIDEERDYQVAALEYQWWALEPHEREGIGKDHAVKLARVLKLQELNQEVASHADVSSRQDKARRDAANMRSEDGIEVNLPKSGWFGRVKTLLRRG